MTRAQQEAKDKKKEHRKKHLKRVARKRFKAIDAECSDDDEGKTNHRRHKRKGEAELRGAPYMEQYRTKKGIEKELDDIDFWREKTPEPIAPSTDDDTVYIICLTSVPCNCICN